MKKSLQSLFALSALASAVASAQTTGAKLDEILVTAERVERNIQATPISMSVMRADDLANRKIQSLADLGDGAIPSLRIAPFYSRSSAITVGIRGIVPFDANQPSRDAGVGVYLDGVYLGRSQGLGAALYDIDRIEVLKGPQGTLFGRNATGGAVSIVTRKPTGEFDLRQTVGFRNFDGYTADTHVDLQRIGDVSIKLDGIVTKRDGTVENPLAGQEDYNSFDRKGFHIRTLWEPTDDFSADYSFDISSDYNTPYYSQILSKNPTAVFSPLMLVQSERAEVADVGVPLQNSVGKNRGHMLNLSWELSDNNEVRSISSYRELTQSQWDNGGAHFAPFVPNGRFGRYSMADTEQDQFSQELQLVGSASEFDYVAGLFYYHEEGSDWAWSPNTVQWNATGTEVMVLPTLVAGAASPFPDRESNAELDSYAAFGQTTWTPAALNEQVKLTVGLRYTNDDKSGVLTKVNGVATAFQFAQTTDRTDPLFIAAWQPLDALHLYAKWGTAYRAGGANSRSVTYRAFAPEEVTTTEAGFKYDFFDGRARLNMAVYETDYQDVQIDFLAIGLDTKLPNRTTIETVNAPGKGTIEGWELEASFAPVSGLTVSASYAYTDGTLPKAANPFQGNRLETVNIVYTPENAYSLSADYVVDVGMGNLLAHIDFNKADGYYSTSSETILTDGSSVANARLALRDINIGGDKTLALSLWSRNLFDDEYTFYESNAVTSRLGATGLYNDPRTWGLDATVNF
jgi:iron complex outermembrane recepter protein